MLRYVQTLQLYHNVPVEFGLGLPSLVASGSTQSVPYYPNEIKTQNEKQLYKEAYVKETGLLRRRSTTNGTGVGLVGFGAFMLVLIGSF